MCLGFFPSTTQWTRLCLLGRRSGDSGDDDGDRDEDDAVDQVVLTGKAIRWILKS